MSKCHFMVIACLAVVISGCQLSGPDASGSREGYFTWVDEQGRVRQSPIPQSTGERDKGEGKEANAEDAPRTGSADSSASGDDSSSGYHEEFNLENYPDANQLEKDGYVRPGEPKPYFTWRDAQGNIRVSYYQPDNRTAVEKGRIKPPIQLTEASIHQPGETVGLPGLPEDADPEAMAVLGIDPGEDRFFQQWAGQCCQALERSEPEQWQEGREFGVSMGDEAPRHSFSTGESHYRLVRLPPAEQITDFILHLRSFNHEGMFVASVAFLDASFAPVRIVTDLVASYVPESWYQYGYLHAYIPVFPSRGERWMVIFTREADLAGQTVIEDKYGPKAIPHTRTGELSLSRAGE